MANTIDLTFLGTSSAQPSVTRSHSSLAVRINGTIWLFDAGEGVQRQLMYSTLKLGKINKIFITHMHGVCFNFILVLFIFRYILIIIFL